MDLNRDEAVNTGSLKFTLDIPESKNHAFIYRRGAKIPKASTNQFKAKTNQQLVKLMKDEGWKEEKSHVWYYLDLYFYFPDKRRRDSHNSIEVLMDSIQESLVADDYYVLPRVQLVELDRMNPRLECVFTPIDYEEQKSRLTV